MPATELKIRTLAHQLSEILDVYASSFDHWREDPSDLGRYERTHANLDLVRVLTDKAFPGGRGELGELLLCHSELKLLVLRRHLARRAPPAPDDPETDLRMLQARHDLLVANLRGLCAQRSQPHGTPGLRIPGSQHRGAEH
ncbi:hypothetical protein JI739_13765 [Ramlibacter sp. AW1]|uniref:Uncharacterized protein n=1 Tax=Ramlibacter aurantiacus TaxID=2801330 RepID=A0A936ZIA5_9BURK|nr:hypothetical protein [Ramlibacter aurantiacus]MBL0421422.1 hypothetical protein [Ramlibacter aurantiacus]